MVKLIKMYLSASNNKFNPQRNRFDITCIYLIRHKIKLYLRDENEYFLNKEFLKNHLRQGMPIEKPGKLYVVADSFI